MAAGSGGQESLVFLRHGGCARPDVAALAAARASAVTARARNHSPVCAVFGEGRALGGASLPAAEIRGEHARRGHGPRLVSHAPSRSPLPLLLAEPCQEHRPPGGPRTPLTVCGALRRSADFPQSDGAAESGGVLASSDRTAEMSEKTSEASEEVHAPPGSRRVALRFLTAGRRFTRARGWWVGR
mgnify:CR=1 FL=1